MTDFPLDGVKWHEMSLTAEVDKAQNILKQRERGGTVESNSEIDEACSELESLFIFQLLKEMRASIPKSDLVSGGRAEEIYTSMLDNQIAKELSSHGGIGLAALFRHQLAENKDTK